jgi:hypothetical protein
MSDSLAGPKYDYTDELAPPSSIGVRNSGSPGAITDAMAGASYYIDAIGFGQTSRTTRNLNRNLQNKPLGLRYFMDTGMKCSNGASMYEYVDNIPKGLGGRAGEEVQRTMGVKMAGLAPGIVEDATSALNPAALFKAALGSGYARCKKVSLPVGDSSGRLASAYNPKNVWIQGPVEMKGGIPHQTRWVFDADISQEDYDKTPKVEKFEGGSGPRPEMIAAGVLLAGVALGFAFALKK